MKIVSGDIFRLDEVRRGLDQVHSAYAERGDLNFTSIPNISIDDLGHVVSLVVDCDEGKQFH